MIHLLIADDHAAVRGGLRQLFGMLDDVVVAAEATNGDEALQAVRRGALDLALIDLSMPGVSGVELIECIRACDTRLPILVLSMHSEPQIVQRMLGAGAQDYLVKGCDAEQIIEAVRRLTATAQGVRGAGVANCGQRDRQARENRAPEEQDGGQHT